MFPWTVSGHFTARLITYRCGSLSSPTTTSTDQLWATSLEAGVSAFKTAPAVSLITLPPTGSIQT